MKTNRKILPLFIFVFFLLCLVPVTVFAEEYVLGEKYYKNFPGTGNKWVELSLIIEYGEKGNEIHYKYSDGYEEWYEYDDSGNQIHRKDSYGDESWSEYNEEGNLIHWKHSSEDEAWYKYDDKGNLIHLKYSDGNEFWYE